MVPDAMEPVDRDHDGSHSSKADLDVFVAGVGVDPAGGGEAGAGAAVGDQSNDDPMADGDRDPGFVRQGERSGLLQARAPSRRA